MLNTDCRAPMVCYHKLVSRSRALTSRADPCRVCLCDLWALLVRTIFRPIWVWLVGRLAVRESSPGSLLTGWLTTEKNKKCGFIDQYSAERFCSCHTQKKAWDWNGYLSIDVAHTVFSASSSGARYCYRNYVCPSVRPSVCHTSDSRPRGSLYIEVCYAPHGWMMLIVFWR